MTVKEKLGQLMLFGFPGREPDEETYTLIREYKAGNVILFSHNIENMSQTRELCHRLRTEIRQATGIEPVISIDQEGGVVSRLPEDGAAFPSAMALAATGEAENARIAAYATGMELAALGINCNLGPVADLNTNTDNPVIGVRSYGKSAGEAVPFILSAIRGQEEAGILSVVKHFPGHGDTEVDSHLGLPCIGKGMEELLGCELLPFQRAVEQGVGAVMAAHILYPCLDPDGIPASMSRKILQGILRQKMGFEGLILSDCMEMKAIQDHFGTPEGFVRAIIAGVDLGCISHTPALAIQALRLAEQAVADGGLTMQRLDEAVERVLACKKRLLRQRAEEAAAASAEGSADHLAGSVKAARRAAEAIMRKAIVRADSLPLPPVDETAVFMGCAAYRTTFASEIRDEENTFPQVMARRFGGGCLITPVNPEEKDIAEALGRTKEGQTVVTGTYNGHLNRGQLRLVNALCEAGRRVIAVALRNPYDLDLISDAACKLAAFEYTSLSFDAVERILRGEPAEGRRCW